MRNVGADFLLLHQLGSGLTLVRVSKCYAKVLRPLASRDTRVKPLFAARRQGLPIVALVITHNAAPAPTHRSPGPYIGFWAENRTSQPRPLHIAAPAPSHYQKLTYI